MVPSGDWASAIRREGIPLDRDGEVAGSLTARARYRSARWGPLLLEAQHRNAPGGLGDDRAVHLGLTCAALAEDDRHLDHLESALDRAVGHLDLEGIAARVDRVEVDRLEHLAAEALEAAGEIAHLHAQHEAGVGAAAAADRPPHRAPVADTAAGHVARADRQVGSFARLEQAR